MAIIRNIAKPNSDDWKKSPLMIKLMEKDRIRDLAAIKKYEESLKKKSSS